VPSESLSVSATPQPHWPGASFAGSNGQPSVQSTVPSPSLSTLLSMNPQPQRPGAVLFGSFGHPSVQSGVPSPSASLPQPTRLAKASQSIAPQPVTVSHFAVHVDAVPSGRLPFAPLVMSNQMSVRPFCA
jgi:hypothetical protein